MRLFSLISHVAYNLENSSFIHSSLISLLFGYGYHAYWACVMFVNQYDYALKHIDALT